MRAILAYALFLLSTFIVSCVPDSFIEDQFRHGWEGDLQLCTDVIDTYTKYVDHRVAVGVELTNPCRHYMDDLEAYLYLASTDEYFLMDVRKVDLDSNLSKYRWEFTFDFWYNPANFDMDFLPFSGETACGVHSFVIDCKDDDQTHCNLIHTFSATWEDVNYGFGE